MIYCTRKGGVVVVVAADVGMLALCTSYLYCAK
jgi:hypothetical protein